MEVHLVGCSASQSTTPIRRARKIHMNGYTVTTGDLVHHSRKFFIVEDCIELDGKNYLSCTFLEELNVESPTCTRFRRGREDIIEVDGKTTLKLAHAWTPEADDLVVLHPKQLKGDLL